MSDLLEAAATALGTPTALVQRAAAARAAANGTTADDILAAWSGGAPAPAGGPQPAAAPAETAVESAPDPSPVAVLEPPPIAIPESPQQVVYEVVEEVTPLEPVAVSVRVRTAIRVGAWTGAALGLFAFLVASAFWAPSVIINEEGRAVVVATVRNVLIGSALVSIVFGAVVASLARAAAASRDPAMQLASKRSKTGWAGAGIGMVVGIAGAAVLTGGFGTAVEESDPAQVLLPVLATLGVMLIGGALLGAITAAVPQIFGTPVAVDDADTEEVAEVRGRLRHAITIPLAGVFLLLLLVLPFAFTLLEANHLVANGAALVAVITAGGILGFAALAGSKPNMKISFGEVMVAMIGIGTLLVTILAVLVFRAE